MNQYINSTDHQQQQQQIQYLNELSHTIGSLAFSFMAPVGVLGCLLSVGLFFLNPSIRQTQGAYLFGWIAIFNMLTLTPQAIMSIQGWLGLTFISDSDLGCKLIQLFVRVASSQGSFLQSFVTILRYANLRHPTRYRFIRLKRFMNLVIFASSLAQLLFSSLSFTYELKNDVVNQTNTTAIGKLRSSSCESSRSIELANDLIFAFTRVIIPSILIETFNLKSICLWAKRRGKALKIKISMFMFFQRRFKRDRAFAISVMEYGHAFIVFNLPLAISFPLYNVYTRSDAAFIADRQLLVAQLNLFVTFGFFFTNLYYSLTLMWNILFNRTFRQQLIQILTHIQTTK